jgi:hypothetical protein
LLFSFSTGQSIAGEEEFKSFEIFTTIFTTSQQINPQTQPATANKISHDEN